MMSGRFGFDFPVLACFKIMLCRYLEAKKGDNYFMDIICGRLPKPLLSRIYMFYAILLYIHIDYKDIEKFKN